MHPYAQTNLQLFNQLRRLGYPDADLRSVDAGYRLMMRVMAAQYRPSEKTFLAHLVGTASILAAHGAGAPLVTAGLTHAAYASGVFAARLPGIHPAKRRTLRQAIGADAENIVADYSQVRWSEMRWGAQGESLAAQLPAIRRDAMFLRAANELEDSLDLGLHYGEPQRRQDGRTNLQQCRTFAQLLGKPSLAAEIAQAVQQLEAPPLPPAVAVPRMGSFTLHSASIPQRCVLALKYKMSWLRVPLHS